MLPPCMIQWQMVKVNWGNGGNVIVQNTGTRLGAVLSRIKTTFKFIIFIYYYYLLLIFNCLIIFFIIFQWEHAEQMMTLKDDYDRIKFFLLESTRFTDSCNQGISTGCYFANLTSRLFSCVLHVFSLLDQVKCFILQHKMFIKNKRKKYHP